MAGSSIVARLGLDSSQFQQGVERAKKASVSLRKSNEDLGKSIGLLGKFAGVFGLTGMYTSALNKAQALRDASVANGTAINANTAALARYADTIDSIKQGAIEVGLSIAGWFNKKGEETGDALVQLFGSPERIRAGQISAEASANADRLNKGKGSAADLKTARDKDQLDRASAAEKVGILIQRNIGYTKELGKYEKGSVEHNKLQQKILETNGQIRAADKDASKEEADNQEKIFSASQDVLHAANDLENAKRDRSRFTIDQLAGMQMDGSTTLGKSAMNARKFQALNARAEQRMALGDFDGADALRGQGDLIAKGLTGAKSTEREPFKGMETRLDEANTKLKTVIEKLGGLLVSQ